MNTQRNAVGWFEIYVNDMPRARAFYEAMLDKKLETLPTPSTDDDGTSTLEMWMFPGIMSPDGPGAGGALCKMEGCEAGAGGTLIYFSCNDCAVESARAAAHGGQILKPKFAIGEYGFIAILIDSEGNTIGLHSMK
jgi:uncharacterized protein